MQLCHTFLSVLLTQDISCTETHYWFKLHLYFYFRCFQKCFVETELCKNGELWGPAPVTSPALSTWSMNPGTRHWQNKLCNSVWTFFYSKGNTDRNRRRQVYIYLLISWRAEDERVQFSPLLSVGGEFIFFLKLTSAVISWDSPN